MTWTFTIDNNLLRSLAEGQVLTQTYTVMIDDGAGGTVAQDMVITITEFNDIPVITGAVATGAVIEDALPTAARERSTSAMTISPTPIRCR